MDRLAARVDERGQQVAVLALLQEAQPKSTLLAERKSVELDKGIGIARETVLCDVGLDTLRIGRRIAREGIRNDDVALGCAVLVSANPDFLRKKVASELAFGWIFFCEDVEDVLRLPQGAQKGHCLRVG